MQSIYELPSSTLRGLVRAGRKSHAGLRIICESWGAGILWNGIFYPEGNRLSLALINFVESEQYKADAEGEASMGAGMEMAAPGTTVIKKPKEEEPAKPVETPKQPVVNPQTPRAATDKGKTAGPTME